MDVSLFNFYEIEVFSDEKLPFEIEYIILFLVSSCKSLLQMKTLDANFGTRHDVCLITEKGICLID